MTPVAPAGEQVDYAEIRRQVQDRIKGVVPEGATVAVVSKGDDELVRIDGRQGWHFPRTATGQYAGHHPYDGAAAIAHLEDVRAGGAQYFALPSVYLWWLDYYEGLAQHLESKYALIADDRETCLVYALAAETVSPADSEGADPRSQQMADFLQALLPEHARFALVTSDEDPELRVGQWVTHPVGSPGPGQPSGQGALEHELNELMRALPGEVDYVVMARGSRRRSPLNPDLASRTMPEWRLIARQENLAFVFGRASTSGGHRR
jgi:hypothetical protein